MAGLQINNFDYSQIFVGNNRYQTAPYTNSGGSPVTIAKGRLLGRVTASQKVLPQVAAATDGSAQPVGVAAETYEVAAGATVDIVFCDSGDVDEGKLSFNAAETLSTAITDDSSIRDAIARNTHIKLVKSSEQTFLDNQ